MWSSWRSDWGARSMVSAHAGRQDRGMNTGRRSARVGAQGATRLPAAETPPARTYDGNGWTIRPPVVWKTKLSAISRPVWGASSASLGLRFRVWRRSVQLDRALAEGVPTARRADLELRAQQLASARVRCCLASGFRAVVADFERPPAAPTPVALMFVALAAAPPGAPTPAATAETMLEIADALTEPGCTRLQGIAHASWLLCDARNSPLYARLPARTMQRIARDALAALHGDL